MTKIEHELIEIERVLDAPVATVFAAWRDADALARWYLPGDERWTSELSTHDFRDGGTNEISFGPRGETPWTESSRYEAIVEDELIVYTMTVARAGVPQTASLVTIQLAAQAGGTKLAMTEQFTAIDGRDSAHDRARGWGEVLDRLEREVG